MVKQPLLSIVITSYSLERLRDVLELLDSLKAQTYPSIETIFVAEHSRELYEQVRIYAEKQRITNVRVLFNNSGQGASAARNLGIKESRGEIIAFIDDDAVAFSDWAGHMIRTYEDDSVIAVTGSAVPHWEDESLAWFPQELHWVVSCTSWCDWKGITEVRNVWLENASFRKEAFELAGLIDTCLGPKDATQGFKGREFLQKIVSEEVELSLRVRKVTGKRVVYNPEVRVKHKVGSRRLKLSYITHWAYWMGYSRQRLKRLYPDRDDNVLNQEHQLLRRILTRLFPSILKDFLRHPVVSWRKLSVTFAALTFVFLGYLVASFSSQRQTEATSVAGGGS